MSPRHAKVALSLCALLAVGVSVNVLFLQKGPPARLAQRASAERTAALSPARKAAPEKADERGGAAKTTATSAEQRLRPESRRPVETAKQAVPAEPAPVAAEPSDGAETVAAIQRELRARGYEPGATDGVPGIVTRAAIMAFEHDNAMPLTGEPSEPLLKAIVAGTTQALIAAHAAGLGKEKRQRSEQVIRTVQQSLTGIGYNSGKASGRISEDTERAIREFETDQRMPVTGRISGPLVARLAKAAGNGKLAAGP